jgi:hypothetical protein
MLDRMLRASSLVAVSDTLGLKAVVLFTCAEAWHAAASDPSSSRFEDGVAGRGQFPDPRNYTAHTMFRLP